MSVELTFQTKVTAVETLETNVPAAAASDKTVTHNGYDTSQSLTGATTPPVDSCAYFEKALSAGAGTIDLTALTGTNGATINLNGKKPVAIRIRGKAGNANPITITKGAANGYDGMGDLEVAVKANQEFTYYFHTGASAVSGTNKTIDLAGTGSQSVEVSIIGGT